MSTTLKLQTHIHATPHSVGDAIDYHKEVMNRLFLWVEEEQPAYLDGDLDWRENSYEVTQSIFEGNPLSMKPHPFEAKPFIRFQFVPEGPPNGHFWMHIGLEFKRSQVTKGWGYRRGVLPMLREASAAFLRHFSETGIFFGVSQHAEDPFLAYIDKEHHGLYAFDFGVSPPHLRGLYSVRPMGFKMTEFPSGFHEFYLKRKFPDR